MHADDALFTALAKGAQSQVEPDLKRTLVSAWVAGQKSVRVNVLHNAIAGKHWSAVMAALAASKVESRMRVILEPRLANSFLRGGEHGLRPVVRHRRRVTHAVTPEQLMARMPHHAATWARNRAADLVLSSVGGAEDEQQQIQDIIVSALEDGLTVDEVTDLIKDIIGLDLRRATALSNYAVQVRDDYAEESAFTAAVERYGAELLASRAETIARTEIMSAINAGQHTLWQEASADGLLDGLQRIWIVTDDPSTACDECVDLADNDPVDLDEPFEAGVDYPPLHPNCRCTVGLVGATGGTVSPDNQEEE